MRSRNAEPERLLSAARAGDAEALGRLLERYRNYLALLARVQVSRRLQNKVDAADLVQETFLEAHKNFARFRGTSEGEFLGWLRQILAAVAVNLVRRYVRTRARDVRLERRLAEDIDRSSQAFFALAARHSSPSEQAARREEAVRLADALEQLPEDYREVVVLSHLEGLSFPEVARRMGRSVDSVKNLWARALARLRRSLGESS